MHDLTISASDEVYCIPKITVFEKDQQHTECLKGGTHSKIGVRITKNMEGGQLANLLF